MKKIIKEEKKETLYFKEILNMEYGINSDKRKSYLILTFLLTTKLEEKKYKSVIRYEDVSDYKFKNTGSLIFLMNNLCIIENKENEIEENKKYHIFDSNIKGEEFEHIDFFCSKIDVISLKKIN